MAQSASQAGLLSLERSHSSSRSPSLPDTSSSSSSIGVIFQVLRLVHSFCKRLSKRRYPRPQASVQHDAFCNDFERQAFIRIDKYLGRRPSDKGAPLKGCNQKPASARDSCKATWQQTLASSLIEVNSFTQRGNHDLHRLASEDFLNRRTHFRVEYLSLGEVARLLDLISLLLNTIQADPSPVCSGYEVLDTYLANLQHILLCLQEQLCRHLIASCLDLVWKYRQSSPKNHSASWHQWFFFEFPNSKHPLSTTWPWSIRPSLAVLWGVCWMFYDSETRNNPIFDAEGNMVDAQGQILVPSHVFDQYLPDVRRQQRQAYFQAANLDDVAGYRTNQMLREMQGPHRSQGGQPSISTSSGFTQPQPTTFAHTSPSPSPAHRDSRSRFARSSSSNNISNSNSSRNVSLVPGGPHHQAGGLSHDALPTISSTNNTYRATSGAGAAPASAAYSSAWVPQDYSHPGLGFDNTAGSAYPADDIAWLPTEQPGLVYEQASQDQPLPPRPRNPSTPAIRVTTDFAGGAQDFSQPQDATYSASSANSSLPPPEYHAYNTYSSGHLSPQRPHFMPQVQDSENMQTPVSPVSPQHSPHDTSMAEPGSRKRSHSEMSHQDVAAIASAAAHSRSGSIVSATSPNEPSDEFYPKRQNTRAFKRGDPPMNEEHKFICDFAEECRGQTFDRKCEWSKHMDKHDRPYRCPHPSCAKLQGFTYSGGLLRHEREVHGKHGGPKAQLMCPYPDCKRHSGKGFTRKENLNEHLRRVHPTGGQDSQNPSLTRDATDITLGLEEGETPASRLSETVDQDDLATSPILGKRKLFGLDADGLHDLEIMKQEVKRLRAEAEEKDERIRQMEEAASKNEERIRQLEALVNMRQLQQAPNEG